jgi:hypothetical protein
MAAIPIIIFDSGFCEVQQGTLFNPPIEIFSTAQKAFYARCPSGWSYCPLGYSVYSAVDGLERKVVVPGIYVQGQKAPNRKFPNYPLKFTREQIAAFAASHLTVAEKIRVERDAELKNLTHDLRAISNEIYHTTLAVKSDYDVQKISNVTGKVESVLNAQQMMSLRLDIIDYESGLSTTRPKEHISPWRKTEKVLKCFQNKMRHVGINYKREGKSSGLVFGPPIFEIIPFVIIAPNGSEISVKFEESESELVLRFESLGPKINDNEREKIFVKNFRGEFAIEAGQTGSGIGLYAAKTLVETHFSGKIFVNQFDVSFVVENQAYLDTRFTVVLPISQIETKEGRQKRRIFGSNA